MAGVAERITGATGALRDALSEPRLRRVQLAWGGTITAEWALIVALGVWAFDAGGPLGVGIMTLARTLPAAVLGPFLAALGDRHRRDLVLTIVSILRGTLVLAVAVGLLGGGPPVVVYALAALDASIYSLYWPAQSSLLAELARRPEELVAANVASTTIENVGALAGPLLAAVILGVASPGGTLAVAGWLLLASALVIVRLALDHAEEVPDPPVDGAVPGILEGEPGGLLEGFRHLASEPKPRLVAGLYLTHTLCFGGLTVLVVVVALQALGIGEAGVGLLTAAMGLGGVAGALAALGLVGSPRLAASLASGVVVWGAATGLLGLASHVSVAVALLVTGGVANAIVDVAALTLLQRLVPERLLARVLGVVEGVWWATLGLGGFLASALAQVLGVRVALAGVGGALAVLALATTAALRRVDEQVVVPDECVALLLGDRLLGRLPTVELERLAMAATWVSAVPGEILIREGDRGYRYYLISSGAVEVTLPDVAVRLGPGEGFGEIALLLDIPRTATVCALEDTVLLAVGRDHFVEALRGSTASRSAAVALITERLVTDRLARR
jgi:MFS family permease